MSSALVSRAENPLIVGLAHAVIHLYEALTLTTEPGAKTEQSTPAARQFEPGVHMVVGYLPGSATSAADALEAHGRSRSRWGRLSLNTRQCIQAGLASLVTLLCAVPVSPDRYYWAMLACLMVLTGTATSGEILVKVTHRVLGTALGVVTAIGAVHLTRGHDTWVVLVMSLCVFVAVYYFRVAYAVLAFAFTTLMGSCTTRWVSSATGCS